MSARIIRQAKEAALRMDLPFGIGVEANSTQLILTVNPVDIEGIGELVLENVLLNKFAMQQVCISKVDFDDSEDLTKIKLTLKSRSI